MRNRNLLQKIEDGGQKTKRSGVPLRGTENRGWIYVISHPSSVIRLRGFTLIEIVITLAMASMVMVTSALLIQSGYRSWNRSYNNANGKSREGTIAAMTALGAVGRKSNRVEYYVYNVTGTTFTRALPVTNPDEVVLGDAVELRYWKDSLKAEYMNPAITATKYALFYLDHGQLKVDYGDYPPAAINAAGHRNTSNVKTVILAENVTYLRFSHTTKNMAGDGNGCVRMKMTITDPDTHESKTTIVASMMRNVWPQ
ncbi:MAG: prepilin-type N-terminal cleavage/methylation domain-containing protein [Sedimentisphaerales bacterium]